MKLGPRPSPVESTAPRPSAFWHQEIAQRYQILDTRYQVPDTRFQIPGTRCQVPDTRYQNQIPDTRNQVPETRFQIPGTRYRAAGRIGTSSRSGGNGPKSCAMCHNFSGGLTLSHHSRTILEPLSYVWKCYFLEPLSCARANEARSSAPVPTTHGVTGPPLHTP